MSGRTPARAIRFLRSAADRAVSNSEGGRPQPPLFGALLHVWDRTALSSLALLLPKPENGVLVRDGNTSRSRLLFGWASITVRAVFDSGTWFDRFVLYRSAGIVHIPSCADLRPAMFATSSRRCAVSNSVLSKPPNVPAPLS